MTNPARLSALATAGIRANATGALKALFSAAYHAGYGGSPLPNPRG
jgi:hypothetical protein